VTIVLVIVGVVLMAAVAVAVQAHRFGGLKAAVSAELRTERKALVQARARVRSLTKSRESELKDARRALEQATSRRQSRIEAAQKAVAEMDNPGTGRKLTGLKDVKLYEHAVDVSGSMIGLYGARADVQTTADSAILVVTDAEGRSAIRSFDTRFRDVGSARTQTNGDIVEVVQDQRRQFSPEQVVQLSSNINNAAVAERQFVEQLPAARAAAARELELAVAETGQIDTAAAQLQALEADSAVLAELTEAQQNLTQVEESWGASKAALVSARSVA
jgi:hypothetical protein